METRLTTGLTFGIVLVTCVVGYIWCLYKLSEPWRNSLKRRKKRLLEKSEKEHLLK